MFINIWIAAVVVLVLVIIVLIISMMSMRRTRVETVIPRQATRTVRFQQPTYREMVGRDHPGDDLLHRPDLSGNIPALESLCDSTPGCVSFNNDGFLKSSIGPTFPSGSNFYYAE